MKRLLALVPVLLMTASLSFAQGGEGFSFRKGYRGNVSVNGNVGVTKGISWNSFGVTTSHGYSFGDGLYLGAGAGLAFEFSSEVSVPVFIDAKYNIIDWKLSPFVDCRFGGEVINSNTGLGGGLIVSPGIGVDFHRFSFRVGYLCEAGKYNTDIFNGEVVSLFKLHSMTITMAVNF